jgi:hypothetical protein
MKKLLSFFFLSVCLFIETAGQRLQHVDSNKYRIDLPDYWKAGNRVWKILTDKLPLVCDEIRDKEICGDDCHPLYAIEFEMSDPVIFDYRANHIFSDYTNTLYVKPSDTWDIQTLYGFECSLLLRNEKGELITRFILVDTNEVWKVSNRVKLPSYSPAPLPVNYNSRRNRSNRISFDNTDPMMQPLSPQIGQEGITPYSYINRNREKLYPTYRDMLNVVDRKINSW